MRAGLVGLKGSGRKTLMAALAAGSGVPAPGRKTITTIRVPDPRVDRLSDIFKPKKTIWSTVEMVLDDSAGASLKALLDSVRALDVLVIVLNGFSPADRGPGGLLADLDEVRSELILADLMVVEKRLTQLRKTGTKDREAQILEHLNGDLDEGKFPDPSFLEEGDDKYLTQYNFLTFKPILGVLNVPESALSDPEWAKASQSVTELGITPVLLSAGIEAEIAELPPEEQRAFLDDLGIAEPASHQLVRSIYKALDLISFFTVGEDEVRAWPVRTGAKAPEAAGKIHSDLERGFIRSETVGYQDFLNAGTMAAAKRAGTWRLEGKEYIVKDGDILSILFKV